MRTLISIFRPHSVTSITFLYSSFLRCVCVCACLNGSFFPYVHYFDWCSHFHFKKKHQNWRNIHICCASVALEYSSRKADINIAEAMEICWNHKPFVIGFDPFAKLSVCALCIDPIDVCEKERERRACFDQLKREHKKVVSVTCIDLCFAKTVHTPHS